MADTEVLGEAMAEEMMFGAIQYMKTKNFDMHDETKFNAILNAIRAGARSAMDEAFTDAKAAFDAHMDQIGTQTAMATMRLAGIRAAKSVLG